MQDVALFRQGVTGSSWIGARGYPELGDALSALSVFHYACMNRLAIEHASTGLARLTALAGEMKRATQSRALHANVQCDVL